MSAAGAAGHKEAAKVIACVFYDELTAESPAVMVEGEAT